MKTQSAAKLNNASLKTALWRGLFLCCPACGRGRLFRGWGILNDYCSHCGCAIRSREDDTWFLMYITTAGITGLFIVAMLLVVPQKVWLGRVLLFISALVVFLGTHASRKGVAIALDYYLDQWLEHPRRNK